MNNPKQIVTKEGYEKILSEIEERETVIREKIADDIEKARQQGDLSENAAYKAAIEAKEFNESRIDLLREQMNNSEIIETDKSSKVGIGKTVKIENVANTTQIEYQIVGHNEADPSQRKISLDSPIGKALVDKIVGDKVLVATPGGEVEFIIKTVK